MSTESYIIRVYRREEENARDLVGMVEIVETQEKRPFSNFDELREILKSSDRDPDHSLSGVLSKAKRIQK
jgi:hypothetical protein